MKTETHKYAIGTIVVLDGVRGIVASHTSYGDEPGYNLDAVIDPEFSHSCRESQIEEFNEDTFDYDNEKQVLSDVSFSAALISHQINGITDKYFRDGNH